MIDTDYLVLEIKVLPAKAKTLSDTTTGSEKDGKERPPMIENRMSGHVLHECSLLFRCKSSSNASVLTGLLRDFSHNSVRWILPYYIIPHCKFECRMQNTVNTVQCSQSKPINIYQMKIEMHHIGKLHIH